MKVVPGQGDPCPRCRQPTEIREHEEITERHLAQPFYYRRWFMCRNPQCKVTTYMPEHHKVYSHGGDARHFGVFFHPAETAVDGLGRDEQSRVKVALEQVRKIR